MIIGDTAGLGVETARDVTKMDARVIITTRDQAKAEVVVESINTEIGDRSEVVTPVVFRRCDLSDLELLKVLTIDLRKELDHIDILVNNAGLLSTELKKTKQGLEMTIGSNFV